MKKDYDYKVHCAFERGVGALNPNDRYLFNIALSIARKQGIRPKDLYRKWDSEIRYNSRPSLYDK